MFFGLRDRVEQLSATFSFNRLPTTRASDMNANARPTFRLSHPRDLSFLSFLSVLFFSRWKSERHRFDFVYMQHVHQLVFKNFRIRKNSITVAYSLSLQGHCQSNLLKLHPLSPDETSVWVTRLINNKCRCFPNFYCMRWLQFFNHKYLKATEKYLVFQTVFSGALRINRSVHSLA